MLVLVSLLSIQIIKSVTEANLFGFWISQKNTELRTPLNTKAIVVFQYSEVIQDEIPSLNVLKTGDDGFRPLDFRHRIRLAGRNTAEDRIVPSLGRNMDNRPLGRIAAGFDARS